MEDFAQSLQQWEKNSRADAFFSVLSDPSKRGGKWDPEEFFETGRRDIANLMKRIQTHGLKLRRGRALDFGCGVGRLTQALAPYFSSVVGVDGAPTMVALAEKHNHHSQRVAYCLNETNRLATLADGSMDFVLSLIVLQHIPNEAALGYLREFLRVLSSDGVLVFQIPSREKIENASWLERARRNFKASLPKPAVEAARRLLRPGQPIIPMYPIAKETVEQELRKAGAVIRQVDPDTWAGHQWESFTYYVMKY